MGVFQIESPGMRGLLRTMKARTLEEMAAALRADPPRRFRYGSKELFLKRLRGQERWSTRTKSLKSILADTLGVCIYQEQVMQIAQAVGGMSLAEAETWWRRRRQNFRAARTRAPPRAKFLKGRGTNGLCKEAGARRTWMMVEKFAGLRLSAKPTRPLMRTSPTA